MLPRNALIAAVTALLSTRAPAQVTLSQIHGGGGNSGAQYLSDYVELYNAGPAQDLTGWSIQYASAAGSTWLVTPLPSAVIDTGHYFLVRLSDGTATGPGQALALPSPDAIAAGAGVAMSGTDGKVALCNTSTALTGAMPTSTAIVDFVGYGTLANWREPFAGGTSADNAPAPSSSTAIFRLGCGASDGNDNNADWAVGAPMPRNAALTAPSGFGVSGMANPYFAEELQTVRLTVTPFACATQAPVSTASVVVDLSAIGSGALPMLDDGTSGDEVAGDGIYSRDVTVALGTSAGTKSLQCTAFDGVNEGNAYIGLLVAPASTPDNDHCSTAVALAGTLPFAISGNLSGASVEYNPLLAVTSPNTPSGAQGARRGLWYSVVGTGKTLTADTCASPLIGGATIPDTVLGVFTGTCDGLTLVGMNDDNAALCGAGAGTERRSRVSWCSVAGATYFVWVAGFSAGAQTLDFTLSISEGASCSGALPASVCSIGSASGTLAEDEAAFGPATNDGCDSSPRAFSDVVAGYPPLVVRGSSRSYGDRRDGDWYRFQAQSAGIFSVTATFTSQGTLELRRLSATGTCATNTLVGSATAQRCTSTLLTTQVFTGEWYAVRIAGFNASSGTLGGIAVGARSSFYRAEFQLGGPPLNDSCANATPLVLGAAPVGGTTAGALPDASSPCDPSGNDVWYSVATSFVGELRIDACGTLMDTAISLYDACGGTLIACNDDCTTGACGAPEACLNVPGLAPGTYSIRVSDKGVAGAFQIAAALAIQNDDCSGALAVDCGSQISGTTVGATPELPSVPDYCPGPGEGTLGGNFDLTAPGVWFALTLPGVAGVDDKTVYADTLTASFDTRLTVFTGTCAALACVTANDDVVGPPSFRSKVAWRAVAGQTYFVLVHGYNVATGSFVLNVGCESPLANDDCAAALVVGPYAGSIQGTTVGATGEPYAYPTGGVTGMASCAAIDGSPSTFSYFDVWYALTAQCDVPMTLSTCGALDTVLSVHTTCPTSSSPNALADACSDDGAAGCAPGSSLVLQLALGQTYWIRVAQADAAQSGGAFNLSWSFADTDGDGADDCVDGCIDDPDKTSPGVCGCGVSDIDSDGDGAPDCVDGCPSDPNKIDPGLCGCGVSEADTDGDGTPDCVDGCPTDPFKIEPGVCGCGVSDVDSDGDGTPDCIDGCPSDPDKVQPGLCGCGVSDVDSDGDGTPDCHDACPFDPLKIDPGVCGCGVADTDSDGDGVLDCLDNCVALSNPLQEDCDLDLVGDVCELAAGTAFDTNANGLPDDCEPGIAIVYCTAGTTSSGCNATLSSAGVASAAASSGFVVTANEVEGNRSGIFFYGITGPLVDDPWGTSTSFLCVKAPTQRGPTQNSGGTDGACDGVMSFDFLAYVAAQPAAIGVPFGAGDVVWTQAWFRDPPSPKTTALSDALQFTLAP